MPVLQHASKDKAKKQVDGAIDAENRTISPIFSKLFYESNPAAPG
jgi:hypothetical protein